jgi:tetratricopeptide (TPR) repeat protein
MRVALYDNLGEMYWLLGENQAAESTVHQAVEVAEASGTPAWFVWQDLASLELRDQNAKALDSIQRGFEAKGSPHWRLHVLRARIVLELDETLNVGQALIDAYAALEQAPPDPRIRRVAALAALRSGDLSAAVSHAQEALRLGDVAAFPHAILAIAEARRGNIEDASAHLDVVHDLWPAELKEAEYLVSTERGMLWFDTAWQLEELVEEARSLVNADDGR